MEALGCGVPRSKFSQNEDTYARVLLDEYDQFQRNETKDFLLLTPFVPVHFYKFYKF